jgi:hypothetical protein
VPTLNWYWKISDLSVTELLAVQEKIIRELRNKAVEKQPQPIAPLDLSVHVLTNWPSDATFRREEI